MDQPPENLSDVDSIQNIETARMALRWALERLQSIEKAKTEAEARFAQEAKQRLKIEEDYRSLEIALDRRVAEAEQRAKALSKLRMEQADMRERALDERQAQFDEFWQTQKLHWDDSIRGVREQIEQQAELRVGAHEKLLAERQAFAQRAWEQEKQLLAKELESWKLKIQAQQERINELEERPARGASETAALAPPAPPSDAVWAEQNQRLLQENARLLSEISDWQEKNQSHFERIQELERALEQPDRQAQREIARLEAVQTHLEAELRKRPASGQPAVPAPPAPPAPPTAQTLPGKTHGAAAVIEAQRQKLDEAQARIIDLEQRLESAEKAAQQQTAFALGRSRQWDQERAQLLAKVEQWRQQGKEAAAQLETLDRQWSAEKAVMADEAASWRQKFEQALPSWTAQKSELALELKELQRKLELSIDHGAALEHRLGLEEKKAQELVLLANERCAQAENERDSWKGQIDGLNSRLGESRLAWDQDRNRLVADLDALRREAQLRYVIIEELRDCLAKADQQTREKAAALAQREQALVDLEAAAAAREAAAEEKERQRRAEIAQLTQARQQDLEQSIRSHQAQLNAKQDEFRQTAAAWQKELEEASERHRAELEAVAQARHQEATARQIEWAQEKAALLDQIERSRVEIARLESALALAEQRAQQIETHLAAQQKEWQRRGEELGKTASLEEKELRTGIEQAHERERQTWEAERARWLKEIQERRDKEQEALSMAVALETRLNAAEEKIKAGIVNFEKQGELIQKLESERSSESSSMAERERELAALRHQLAEDYRKKQVEIESLKEQLGRDIAELIRQAKG